MRRVPFLLSVPIALCAQQAGPLQAPSWHVAAQQFIALPGASGPKLLSTKYSTALKSGLSHSVSVIFEISREGVPFNIRVEHSSDPESEDEVIALIREWRFEAALKDGIPVASKGYLELLMDNSHSPADPHTARPKIKQP